MTDTAILAPRRRPRFRRPDEPPAFQITERDIEIVRQVARHRFLRSTHVSRLLAAPHHKICERLKLLYRAKYLDRPRAQLDYHVQGGGSTFLVYALGNRGARLLTEHDGPGDTDIDWARKNAEATRQFLLHTLSIADLRVALTLASRASVGVRLQEPEELLQSVPAETRAAEKPWNWRVRVQHNGAQREIGLIPDWAFALSFADGTRRVFLVECDRGTMPVERATLDQTSMLRKFLAYEGGRRQELHARRFGWKNFRVLTVTSSPERTRNMQALISRTSQLKASPLFLFADHAGLMRSNVLAGVWTDASGKTQALLKAIV